MVITCIELTVAAVNNIITSYIVINDFLETVQRLIACLTDYKVRITKHLIDLCILTSEMHFGTHITNLTDISTAKSGNQILCQQSTYNPLNENPVNIYKRVTFYQIFRFKRWQYTWCIQHPCHINRQFIILIPVQHVIHQIIHKSYNIAGFIGHKTFPSFRQLTADIAVSIRYKYGNQELLQCRGWRCKTKLLFYILPEAIQ